ncbi:hypothetical protein HZB78_03100 [Candidatus Collierbacteria bacterium]|nr:hypothetical protein [Candidatus Collierbacteria bacterium]
MRKLLLIDGHSLIHRAYHAYPKTLATGTGELTNAVYGFTNILLTAISEVQPTHLAVSFDLPKPTFRQAMFVGYKRSRVKPDDELITQIPRVKEVVKTLNIPIYEVEGFEADDVIGTLAKQASELLVVGYWSGKKGQGFRAKPSSQSQRLNQQLITNNQQPVIQIIILTSDRDLMQLIRGDRVVVQLPAKGKIPAKTVTESDFFNSWGFSPQLLPDYKALAGDQSDDIPGVKGIGEKTAKELVSGYGEINNIYRELFKGPVLSLSKGQALINKLADGQDSAQLSKKLATIDTDVSIKLDWEQTEIHEYDKQKVLKLFDELQFKSLVKKLPNDAFEQTVQDVLF